MTAEGSGRFTSHTLVSAPPGGPQCGQIHALSVVVARPCDEHRLEVAPVFICGTLRDHGAPQSEEQIWSGDGTATLGDHGSVGCAQPLDQFIRRSTEEVDARYETTSSPLPGPPNSMASTKSSWSK
jgi:hypothetical protein